MSDFAFPPPADGSLAWEFALDLTFKLTVLYLLVMLIHVLLGRRRPLSRSGLWNAFLVSLVAATDLHCSVSPTAGRSAHDAGG